MRHHLLPAAHIRQARQQLLEHGSHAMTGLDLNVTRSWQRSASFGLSPIGRISAIDNLTATELMRLRHMNEGLMNHSLPVMEYLHEQVAHSESTVILSDAQGVLMQTLGDLNFLNKAERVALMSGASWSEAQRGTNAIGTALAEKTSIEIHGSEHFLDRNGFLTCAASPIVSATGCLMGVLDISSDYRNRQPHNLGLVSTAARMIENSLLRAYSADHVLIKLHSRPEGIETIAQALLVMSHDGWLLGMNRRAMELLNIQYQHIGAVTWEEIFLTAWDVVQTKAQTKSERAFGLHTNQGLSLFARVYSKTIKYKCPVANQTSSHQSVSNLGKLDTGDRSWRLAIEKAMKVCDKDIPMLITGESGVGKEVFARAIHSSSQRAHLPFVAINCAAIPEHLIESELFGYVPGAFTGASKTGSPGRLREVNGGTLFLDEIGDMPPSLQTRLLRVLQERQVTPVGSGQSISVSFHLICATHCKLKESIDQGTFRSDLFYRINGLHLHLPPLREREDFMALVQCLLVEHAPDEHFSIDPVVLQAMQIYAWPGNLRQLSQVIKTAVALMDTEDQIMRWSHLPDDLAQELINQASQQQPLSTTPPQNLNQLSAKAIQCALENCRGNVSAAAKQLGISRQTLYRKLQSK
jgi:transcriptional regulator of acetoin/glycerol metabolism